MPRRAGGDTHAHEGALMDDEPELYEGPTDLQPGTRVLVDYYGYPLQDEAVVLAPMDADGCYLMRVPCGCEGRIYKDEIVDVLDDGGNDQRPGRLSPDALFAVGLMATCFLTIVGLVAIDYVVKLLSK